VIFKLLKFILKNLLTYVSTFDMIYVSTKKEDCMSPRTGRPTVEPKTLNTRIRMSDKDVEKLEFCSKETGMTKAEVIRKGIDLVYKKIKK